MRTLKYPAPVIILAHIAVRGELTMPLTLDSFIAARPKIAVITSCSKSKMPLPAKAVDFYLGQFFAAAKQLSTSNNADFWVMSGLYGLLHGSEVVEPYDHKIKGKKDVERLRPTVQAHFPRVVAESDFVLLLMGKTYCSVFSEFFDCPNVLIATDNRGSGGFKQLAYQLNQLSPSQLIAFFKWAKANANRLVSVETLAKFLAE